MTQDLPIVAWSWPTYQTAPFLIGSPPEAFVKSFVHSGVAFDKPWGAPDGILRALTDHAAAQSAIKSANERISNQDDIIALLTASTREAQLIAQSANERIAALEKLIDQHNAEIISNCEGEYNRNARACEAWTGRGRQCPDCPKDYLIDAIDRAQSGDPAK